MNVTVSRRSPAGGAEPAGDRPRGEDDREADAAHHGHRAAGGAPARAGRQVGLAGAEVLADEGAAAVEKPRPGTKENARMRTPIR